MPKADEIKARIGLAGPPLSHITDTPPEVPDHEMVRCIGQGSYGEVWLARNAVGTWRAVKVVHRDHFQDARPYEREFIGIQKYEPNSRTNEGLVDILQIGRNDAEGYFYYVMELADNAAEPRSGEDGRWNGQDGKGGPEVRTRVQESEVSGQSATGELDPGDYIPKTLAREIRARGRLPVEECITLGMTLNLALGHLHRNGLIHRDVKPSNIIFVNGVPKLADIGLVTELAEAQSFVGTEGFIPPEGPNSPQADLYALGKVLYEASMGKDRQEYPEPYSGLGVDADSMALMELNAVLLRACAARAKDRYQSAEEMNADLALLHSGRSVREKHALVRRLRITTHVAAAVVAVLVLGVVPYYWAIREAGLAMEAAKREVGLRKDGQRFVYAAKMNLAQEAWEQGKVKRVRELLDETAAAPERGFEWYYWRRQVHLELMTLRGHTKAINAVLFSPDGTRIVTASADQTGVVWDAVSGRALTTLKGHNGFVTCLAFSPDGRRIVTGSGDASIKVWDLNGKQLFTIPGDGLSVYCVSFSPDGQFIAAGGDGQASRVYDSATGRELVRLEGHTARITCVAFSADGQRLATGSRDQTIRIWRSSDGRELQSLKGHHAAVLSLAFSSDGQSIASGSEDHTVKVWETATGLELLTLTGHLNSVNSVAYSADGLKIASGSEDGSAKVWDASSGKQLFTLEGHTERITWLDVEKVSGREHWCAVATQI